MFELQSNKGVLIQIKLLVSPPPFPPQPAYFGPLKLQFKFLPNLLFHKHMFFIFLLVEKIHTDVFFEY